MEREHTIEKETVTETDTSTETVPEPTDDDVGETAPEEDDGA